MHSIAAVRLQQREIRAPIGTIQAIQPRPPQLTRYTDEPV